MFSLCMRCFIGLCLYLLEDVVSMNILISPLNQSSVASSPSLVPYMCLLGGRAGFSHCQPETAWVMDLLRILSACDPSSPFMLMWMTVCHSLSQPYLWHLTLERQLTRNRNFSEVQLLPGEAVPALHHTVRNSWALFWLGFKCISCTLFFATTLKLI